MNPPSSSAALFNAAKMALRISVGLLDVDVETDFRLYARSAYVLFGHAVFCYRVPSSHDGSSSSLSRGSQTSAGVRARR